MNPLLHAAPVPLVGAAPQPATQAFASSSPSRSRTMSSPGVNQPNKCTALTIHSTSVTNAVRFQACG